MTPKEKARDLIRTFKPYSIDDYAAFTNAYRCVDEIIKANPTEFKLVGVSGPDANYNAHYEYENNESYWEQVKQELQKL